MTSETSRAELKYLLERQREEIKTLHEMGRLLSSVRKPVEIIRLVAAYLHRTFPAALCVVWLSERRQLHLVPFAPVAELELSNAVRDVRAIAVELLGRPIAEEELGLVRHPAEEQAASWMQPLSALRDRLTVPLSVQDRPIGLLGLFSGQAKAFSDEDRHAVGIVAEQLGSALRQAFLVEELTRADELKNQMLSIVSHELSTPLTAIKEGVALVTDGSLGATTAEQHDFLVTVLENVGRLDRLLQKVKTSTGLMTGQVALRQESADLRTVVAAAVSAYRPMAEVKRVTLSTVEPPAPTFWRIDRARLTEALGELVENAVHATEGTGSVTLKLTATPSEAQLELLDTGCGIAKEALPTLFDRFQSLGSINERKMGGLGLGCFIAKSLIVLHGGTIEVDSAPGRGTRLLIRLPKPEHNAP